MADEEGKAMALKTAKKELRSLMKQKLSAVSSDSINTQSTRIFNSITSFEPYQDAKRIGIYLSMPSGEVQTDNIVRHALGAGKQVFVPYLHKVQNPPPDTPKSVMEMVDLLSLSNYESLQRDSWGIPTIGIDTLGERESILDQSSVLDMILMPGVAFDIDPITGYIRRLGHGKGFYDYFLHRYRAKFESHEGEAPPGTDVLLYGLALEEQCLDVGNCSVPVGKHDSLLHGLVVGDGKFLYGPP